jgi:hypothetical protein
MSLSAQHAVKHAVSRSVASTTARMNFPIARKLSENWIDLLEVLLQINPITVHRAIKTSYPRWPGPGRLIC